MNLTHAAQDVLRTTEPSLVARGLADLHPISEQRGAFVLRGELGGAPVAVKVASRALAPEGHPYDPETVQRQEIRVLQELGADAGDLYVDSGDGESSLWLVTRWIEGRPASSLAAEIRAVEDVFERGRLMARLLIALARPLVRLHRRGYVHGDLQGAHWLLDAAHVAHLIDFGLCKKARDPEYLYEGGLVHFDSPEVASRMIAGTREPVQDEVSEIYSFGAVAYVLWTAASPLEPVEKDFRKMLEAVVSARVRTFEEAGAGVFPALETVVTRCMAKERTARFSSMEEVVAALGACEG